MAETYGLAAEIRNLELKLNKRHDKAVKALTMRIDELQAIVGKLGAWIHARAFEGAGSSGREHDERVGIVVKGSDALGRTDLTPSHHAEPGRVGCDGISQQLVLFERVLLA